MGNNFGEISAPPKVDRCINFLQVCPFAFALPPEVNDIIAAHIVGISEVYFTFETYS